MGSTLSHAKRNSLIGLNSTRIHRNGTSTSVMERQFNRTGYHQNQDGNILPVILYLTLPTVNLHRNTSMTNNRKVKHQKQKQRDFERMKQFNQQKTVCSVFPFYQLENDDIQNMVTQPTPVQFSKTNSSLEKTKMCNLQEKKKMIN